MTEAILIFIAVVWTFFGLIILYNIPDRDLRPSLRMAIAIGPIIVVTFFFLSIIMRLSEATINWIRKA